MAVEKDIMQGFVEMLTSIYKLSDITLAYIQRVSKIKTIRKGDFYLREGEIAKYACYVYEGLAVAYVLKDGVAIATRFNKEGSIIVSFASFYTRQPSIENVMMLENTTIVYIDYSNLGRIYHDFLEFNYVGRKLVEHYLYESEMRNNILRKHTAEERYKIFCESEGDLIQRIPLKYIATYLGMNPETLSRLRAKK